MYFNYKYSYSPLPAVELIVFIYEIIKQNISWAINSMQSH